MYMNDSSSLKSALKSRRSKMAPDDAPPMMEQEDPADKPGGDNMSDLAPLPDHSEQDDVSGGDMGALGTDDGQPIPVVDIQKTPKGTKVSIDIPLMDSKMGAPDMDDMHDEMTAGMNDSDQQSLMSREPKSITERARKAALMSKSNKM